MHGDGHRHSHGGWAMHRHLAMLWICSGLLVFLLVLSLTGNGTLATGIPVWVAIVMVAAAIAAVAWWSIQAARRG